MPFIDGGWTYSTPRIDIDDQVLKTGSRTTEIGGATCWLGRCCWRGKAASGTAASGVHLTPI